MFTGVCLLNFFHSLRDSHGAKCDVCSLLSELAVVVISVLKVTLSSAISWTGVYPFFAR